MTTPEQKTPPERPWNFQQRRRTVPRWLLVVVAFCLGVLLGRWQPAPSRHFLSQELIDGPPSRYCWDGHDWAQLSCGELCPEGTYETADNCLKAEGNIP